MAFRVVNKTRGKVLATRAVEASGFYDRLVGLLGRAELPFGEGLHLVPCNSIHTLFMRMPIDALFLDADGKVRKALPALPPWRVTGIYFGVRSVLELPAGTLAGSGTVEGDVLAFEPSE